MADDEFRVEGADALLKLGKRLKASQGAPVVKEMTKALSKTAKDRIVPATRAEALKRLPSSGGLAKRVAKAPQRVTSRVGNTSASVRVIVGGKKSGAYGANVGKIRHPIFGRKQFVDQQVEPGWHTETAEKEAPKAQGEIVEVMTEFAQRLSRPV